MKGSPVGLLEGAFSANSSFGGLFFTEEELSSLDRNRVPKHVAIIMDGNRRWAVSRNLPPMMGHWRGADAITEIVRAARQIGVRVLTLYAFSTENWGRSEAEIEALMRLFETYLDLKREEMVEEGIKLSAIGDLARLPFGVRRALEATRAATEHCLGLELILALNYGGRDDICRAASRIALEVQAGRLDPKEVSEQLFSRYLDTAAWPDPDLLIRTSGEKRLSNFLLWQVSYSEVLLTDVPWPEFSGTDFLKGILEYQRRVRRLGGA